jgi:hypothetical protein
MLIIVFNIALFPDDKSHGFYKLGFLKQENPPPYSSLLMVKSDFLPKKERQYIVFNTFGFEIGSLL